MKKLLLLVYALASTQCGAQITQALSKDYFNYWGSDELSGVYTSIDVPNPNTWFELCIYFDYVANRYQALVINSRLEGFQNQDTLFAAEKTNRLCNYTGWIRDSKRFTRAANFQVHNEILTVTSANATPLFFRRTFKGLPAASCKSYGTGFFINENHIATNWHVIKSASTIEIEQKIGEETWLYKAELVASDSLHDMAILKINDAAFTPLQALPYAIDRIEKPQLAEKVWSLGYPQALNYGGKSLKYTEGNITALKGVKDNPVFLQTDLTVLPGSSGSPLFDETGKHVCGILTSCLVWSNGVEVNTQTDFSYASRIGYLTLLMQKSGISLPIVITNKARKEQREIVEKRASFVVLVKIR